MSMIRKLETACRAAFAWKPFGGHALSNSCLIERNDVTGAFRWCRRTSPRGVPDNWKDGLPRTEDLRPQRPTIGSGVKPAPEFGKATDDLLKRIREAMPHGLLLEAGDESVLTPPRIYALEPMARGGFVVSAGGSKTFAGTLTDCLNFIESELGDEPC